MPIFTNGLNDAKYRVVQADARDIRAAAVEEILTNWSKKDSENEAYSLGAENANSGWVALAYVDTAGHISGLKIDVQDGNGTNTISEEKSYVGIHDNNTDTPTRSMAETDVSNRKDVLALDGLKDGTKFYVFEILIKSLSSPNYSPT